MIWVKEDCFGKEMVLYSSDVIEKIRELNGLLVRTYPECAHICAQIEKVIREG